MQLPFPLRDSQLILRLCKVIHPDKLVALLSQRRDGLL